MGLQSAHSFEQSSSPSALADQAAPENRTEAKPGVQGPAANNLKLERQGEDGGFKIPGFGSFEILPKLDFGLELLYSDPSRNTGAETPVPETGNEDVKIRGTLKKRF